MRWIPHSGSQIPQPLNYVIVFSGGKTQMEVGEMDSPVWVPDSSATKCMHCHRSEFSMLNRRVSAGLFSLFLYIYIFKASLK